MAYMIRGKRVAYDNIAAGSVTGQERVLGNSTSDLAAVSDPSLWSPDSVSQQGCVFETGGFNNIANAALPGVEDTEGGTADKLTSDGEDISDAG